MCQAQNALSADTWRTVDAGYLSTLTDRHLSQRPLPCDAATYDEPTDRPTTIRRRRATSYRPPTSAPHRRTIRRLDTAHLILPPPPRTLGGVHPPLTPPSHHPMLYPVRHRCAPPPSHPVPDAQGVRGERPGGSAKAWTFPPPYQFFNFSAVIPFRKIFLDTPPPPVVRFRYSNGYSN